MSDSTTVQVNDVQSGNAPWYRLLPVILYAALPMLVPEGLFPGALMWAALAPALLALLVLIIDAARKKLRLRSFIEYAPMACYAAFLIAAYIFCRAKNTSVLGCFTDTEGFLYGLSFMFILFYILNTAQSARDIRWIFGSFSFAVIALAVLDAGRLAGFWSVGGHAGLWGIDAQAGLWNIEGLAGEDARLLFISMLIPVTATLFIREDRSHLKRRVIKLPLLLIVFAALSAQLLLTDISSGIPAVAIGLAVTLLFFTKKLRAWSRALLVLFIVIAVLLTATSKVWPHATKLLRQRFVSGTGKILAVEKSPNINYIHTEGSSISISFGQEGHVLNTEVNTDSEGRITGAEFFDKDGVPLNIGTYDTAEKAYNFSQEPYKSAFNLCIIKNQDEYFLQIATPEKSWRFAASEGGLQYVSKSAEAAWPMLVPIAALLLIFLIRCFGQLFWRDPENLPAGMEAAASLKGVLAFAAALIMCSLSARVLPAFYVLLGAGIASLDINGRFSINERSNQNGI